MERIIFNPCEHSFEIKADTATQGEKEFYRKISEEAEASILKMHLGVPLEKWTIFELVKYTDGSRHILDCSFRKMTEIYKKKNRLPSEINLFHEMHELHNVCYEVLARVKAEAKRRDGLQPKTKGETP